METSKVLEGAEVFHSHFQTSFKEQDLLHAQVHASPVHKGKKRLLVVLQRCLLRIAAGLLAQLLV